MQVTVTGLFNYPVKSFRACAQTELIVNSSGLDGDRRWMLVNGKGEFLTQRQLPIMATISVACEANGLMLETVTGDAIRVITPAPDAPTRQVQVWQDSCAAQGVSPAVDNWLSATLGRPCHLVYMPPSCRRPLRGFAGNTLGFADGYPLLLTSTASLRDLNNRLQSRGIDAVPMSRFRPNLVVDGQDLMAFAEDEWAALSIGDLRLVNAKPCGRCMVITTDQQSGDKQRNREPLATLREFRTDAAGEVLFGINLVPETLPATAGLQLSHSIAMGDQLQVRLS